MKLLGVDLIRIAMPLVSPFRTSFGTQTERDILLLRAVTDESEGWGECVALTDPVYSSEYLESQADVLRRFFLPALASADGQSALDRSGAAAVATVLHPYKGHRMAKAAIEMALLDAELRASGRSFARELGAVHDRVPSGVSVGIFDAIPQLLEAVGGYLAEGYVRIKLKIEPGWDLEPVRAVREQFGDDVLLQVDANTAYTVRDARHLAKLDAFGLLLIEQPLEEEDILGHAELARQLTTPICLDESIVSAQTAAAAITLGACQVVNIKPGRVGGYLEARRIHDLAARARGRGVVRWDARDRPRPSRQRGPGGAARFHAPRRHLGLGPLLPHRHHRAVRDPRRTPDRAHGPGSRSDTDPRDPRAGHDVGRADHALNPAPGGGLCCGP